MLGPVEAHVQPFAYLARDAAKRLKDRLNMTVQDTMRASKLQLSAMQLLF